MTTTTSNVLLLPLRVVGKAVSFLIPGMKTISLFPKKDWYDLEYFSFKITDLGLFVANEKELKKSLEKCFGKNLQNIGIITEEGVMLRDTGIVLELPLSEIPYKELVSMLVYEKHLIEKNSFDDSKHTYKGFKVSGIKDEEKYPARKVILSAIERKLRVESTDVYLRCGHCGIGGSPIVNSLFQCSYCCYLVAPEIVAIFEVSNKKLYNILTSEKEIKALKEMDCIKEYFMREEQPESGLEDDF